MSADQSVTDPPLPSRIAWFAPWRWPLWARAVIVALALIGYPASIGPTVWLNDHGLLPASLYAAHAIVYCPLELAMGRSETVYDVMVWYISLWQSANDPAGFMGSSE